MTYNTTDDVKVELSGVADNDETASISSISSSLSETEKEPNGVSEEDEFDYGSFEKGRVNYWWMLWSLVLSLLLAGLATTAVIYPQWRLRPQDVANRTPTAMAPSGLDVMELMTPATVVSMFVGMTPLFLMQFGLGMPYIAKVVFVRFSPTPPESQNRILTKL